MKNYYAILEVPVGSSIETIREAYRRLAQENLWNKEAFAELKEAYEVLTTPVRRAEYDQVNFGQTFAAEAAPTLMVSAAEMSNMPTLRHCPMGAGPQCPVINARAPLSDTYCPECGYLLASMPADGFETVATVDITQEPRLEEPSGRAHRLRPGLNSVGREGTDVVLPDKTISRQHAQVDVAPDGAVLVEDLGSTNGTQVNGERLSARVPRPLASGDSVRFGSVLLQVRLPGAPEEAQEVEKTLIAGQVPEAEPAAMVTPPSLPPGARLVSTGGHTTREHLLVPGVTTFGRRAENSVVIRDDPFVSGSHAQIIAEDDTYRLTDVGSTNGTFVNGERLTPNAPVTLSPGDEVTIGSAVYLFERLAPPAEAEAREDESPGEASAEPEAATTGEG